MIQTDHLGSQKYPPSLFRHKNGAGFTILRDANAVTSRITFDGVTNAFPQRAARAFA